MAVPLRVRSNARDRVLRDVDRNDFGALRCERQGETAVITEGIEQPPASVRRRGNAILALVEE